MRKSLTPIIFIVMFIIAGAFYVSHQQSQRPLNVITPTQFITKTVSKPQPILNLHTKYISTVDWPPKESIENQQFSCTEAGSEINGSGQTKKEVVNNHTYCVTKETQGAAGSIYTQYAYARAKGSQTEIFTFSLRYVQCDNYPEPEKTVCTNERQSFDVNNFMDRYIQNQ